MLEGIASCYQSWAAGKSQAAQTPSAGDFSPASCMVAKSLTQLLPIRGFCILASSKGEMMSSSSTLMDGGRAGWRTCLWQSRIRSPSAVAPAVWWLRLAVVAMRNLHCRSC